MAAGQMSAVRPMQKHVNVAILADTYCIECFNEEPPGLFPEAAQQSLEDGVFETTEFSHMAHHPRKQLYMMFLPEMRER
jgi:hypothetical protein